MSANSKLEALRNEIRALEAQRLNSSVTARVLPFADERLNAPFPDGGLQIGALHEFCAWGLERELTAGVTAFAATVAANLLRFHDGFILWAASQANCYPPGLICFGLPTSRIIWVDCLKDAEVLSVMEEALHSRSLTAVLGEAGTLSLKMGRRLNAAARHSNIPALLIRRYYCKPSKIGDSPSGAATTRWRVSAVARDVLIPPRPVPLFKGRGSEGSRRFETASPLTSGQRGDLEPGLGLPRWRLDLEYCRNGRTASWIVEASDGATGSNGKAGHVRVVAELCDDAYPFEEAPSRETA